MSGICLMVPSGFDAGICLMEMYFNVNVNKNSKFPGPFAGAEIHMCLAVVAQLKEIKENVAVADFGGLTQEIRLDLIEEPKVDDWVLVHTGFAIQRIDEQEAREMLKIMDEIAEINDAELQEIKQRMNEAS
jgi:hydrogenase expression/formation protein HypC